jgi:hypothetical protein
VHLRPHAPAAHNVAPRSAPPPLSEREGAISRCIEKNTERDAENTARTATRSFPSAFVSCQND